VNWPDLTPAHRTKLEALIRNGVPRRSTWSPPRGDRLPDGRWEYTLAQRPITEELFSPAEARQYEGFAVTFYRKLIGHMRMLTAEAGLTVRDLARDAGLSLSVTTGALTGSTWPRWSTMESLAAALNSTLETRSTIGVPVIPALLARDIERAGRPTRVLQLARGEVDLADVSQVELELLTARHALVRDRHSGATTAKNIGIRKNTYYDLSKPDRTPSSSVVFALSAQLRDDILLIKNDTDQA
jgi:transcriptional regulator with XRE-family HTH domain